MIDQRPHILVSHSSTTGTYNDNGDWIPGVAVNSVPVRCRVEGNDAGREIRLDDGSAYVYSYMVYLGQDSPEYSHGQKIDLYDEHGVLLDSVAVKKFSRGQLNSRIWA